MDRGKKGKNQVLTKEQQNGVSSLDRESSPFVTAAELTIYVLSFWFWAVHTSEKKSKRREKGGRADNCY